MEDLKMIHDILNMTWKTVRENKKTESLSEQDFDVMVAIGCRVAKEIESEHGMAERHLFSKLFMAMTDYLGEKQNERTQRV